MSPRSGNGDDVHRHEVVVKAAAVRELLTRLLGAHTAIEHHEIGLAEIPARPVCRNEHVQNWRMHFGVAYAIDGHHSFAIWPKHRAPHAPRRVLIAPIGCAEVTLTPHFQRARSERAKSEDYSTPREKADENDGKPTQPVTEAGIGFPLSLPLRRLVSRR
jgi:hypothetical protein